MTTEIPLDPSAASGSAVTAAWPDLFANLQAAYARVIDAQFEMERRAAELEDSRDLLRQVIASMSEALFLLDRTGRVMQVNPAALALIGQTENDCVGQLFRKICPSPDAPISAWKILNKSAQGSLTGLETKLCSGDGQMHPVNLSAAVVRNRNGRIDGVLIIAQDRQPQQELQNELVQSQRRAATAQFADSMAQVLADPVEVIRGYSQHLRHVSRPGDTIDEQWQADLQRIEAAADKITQLVAQLQVIGQPASGTFKPLNLSQLVEAALLLTAVRGHTETIPIHRELAASLPAVQGDWHELAYAVADLVQSLREKLARQLTAVTVRTWPENKQVCLRITGNLASPVNEPSFRYPSFVEDVISQHNGEIRIEVEMQQVSLLLQFPGLRNEE